MRDLLKKTGKPLFRVSPIARMSLSKQRYPSARRRRAQIRLRASSGNSSKSSFPLSIVNFKSCDRRNRECSLEPPLLMEFIDISTFYLSRLVGHHVKSLVPSFQWLTPKSQLYKSRPFPSLTNGRPHCCHYHYSCQYYHYHFFCHLYLIKILYFHILSFQAG